MNPQMNEAPGLHLPQPAGMAGQGSVPLSPQQPYAPVPAAEPAALPATPSQSVDPATPAPGQPGAIADEASEVLDEEWVAKAREIVKRYPADPFTQSHELSKLKAQYLKVRYHKDIKVSEG